jgi:serine/threonine protein kinase
MDRKLDNENPDGDETAYDQLQTVEQLADEFVLAIRQGNSPSIETYAAAYPKMASQIRELFPTIIMMEQARDQSLTRRKDGRVSKGPEEIQQLGDFRIIREIGRGGMGIVYEAEQQSLGRRVALKILPKNSFSETQLEQFERESRLAARLHHTNIVPVYGVGHQAGLNYYVMQLIDGQNLGQFVESPGFSADDADATEATGNSLTLKQVCEIGRQVAFALDYAHRQGILHRDIKPSNMILDSRQNVWITDFGLAIGQDTNTTKPFAENHVFGTLRFLPPEKMAGQPDTPESDIYSLGISLIELLAGKPAFDFSVKTDLVDRIKNGVLDEFPQQTPEDLTAVLKKTIAVEPQDRYPTAIQLAEDLENFLEHRPVSCRKSSAVHQVIRWAKRNPALAAMSGAFALLLITASLVSSIGYFRVQSAWHSEKQHRDRAEDASRLAAGSLNRIFSRFAPDSQFAESGRDLNLTQPILSDEVVAMLQDLLVFYQQLASNDSDDPELGYRAALAQCRVGEINEKLGHYERASESYKKALTDFAGLPDSDNFTLQTAKIYNQLGYVHRMMGDAANGKSFHENAISDLTMLDRVDAETDLLKTLELARSHYYLGHQVRPGTDPTSLPPVFFSADPAAQDPGSVFPDFVQLDKAIAILNSIETESTKVNAAKRHLLALCFREYANDLWEQRTELDIQSELTSIELLEQLSAEYPQETIYRFDLMQVLAEINVFEPGIKLPTLEKARQALKRAIRIGEQLVEVRPDIASFRVAIVHAYFKQATITDRMSELVGDDQAKILRNESEEFYRQALLGQEFLARRFPDRPGYRVWLARFSLSLANCSNLSGQTASRKILIGKAIGNLVNLPADLKTSPQVKALQREANPLIE